MGIESLLGLLAFAFANVDLLEVRIPPAKW
jgi:hypothetical protein